MHNIRLPTVPTLLLWLATSLMPYQVNASPIVEFTYQLLETQAHNPNSFTQGWIKDGDTFFESSGHYGRSFVQRYSDGSTATAHLPRKYFAEGLTLFDNTLYLLTWKEGTLLLLDKHSLKIKQRIRYQGEGWGLSHNGKELIMSNGTPTLLFRDPDTFTINRRIVVSETLQLNELEYVDGVIWANNWKEDQIYAINSHNGCLLGTVDLSRLRTQLKNKDKADVLNGIAYDVKRKAFWVTGKYWSNRYLIRLPAIVLTADKHC